MAGALACSCGGAQTLDTSALLDDAALGRRDVATVSLTVSDGQMYVRNVERSSARRPVVPDDPSSRTVVCFRLVGARGEMLARGRFRPRVTVDLPASASGESVKLSPDSAFVQVQVPYPETGERLVLSTSSDRVYWPPDAPKGPDIAAASGQGPCSGLP